MHPILLPVSTVLRSIVAVQLPAGLSQKLIFSWQPSSLRVTTSRSLKPMDSRPSPTQPCVRERGENPRRLRHCNGLQTPIATVHTDGKAGARSSPESGYRFGCARLVVVASVCDRRIQRQLLRQEKDEASPPNCFRRDSLNAFIRRFDGSEGFFIFVAAVCDRRHLKNNPAVADRRYKTSIPSLVSQSQIRSANSAEQN